MCCRSSVASRSPISSADSRIAAAAGVSPATVSRVLSGSRKARPETESRDRAAAREMVRRTGQMGVPVIEIGGKPIIGFDRAQIDRLLGLTR